MPRKTIRRFLPDIHGLLNQPSLRWVRRLAMDPNLFHLNRYSVSLAVAVGVFCAFIPLPGQTLIALLLCYALGANLPIGVLLIWISNPITIPPMFYLTYQLGTRILDTEAIQFTVQMDWQWFKNLGNDILLPLFVGSFICGTILAIISYFIIFYLWRWKVVKNWRLRTQKRLFNQRNNRD
jgi:uncharacterized protein (DUF2062 family)